MIYYAKNAAGIKKENNVHDVFVSRIVPRRRTITAYIIYRIYRTPPAPRHRWFGWHRLLLYAANCLKYRHITLFPVPVVLINVFWSSLL